MPTFDTPAQAVSYRLQVVERILADASLLAEQCGSPDLGASLALASSTAHLARASFNHDTEHTSAVCVAFASPLGELEL
jgi:hypothetical protein